MLASLEDARVDPLCATHHESRFLRRPLLQRTNQLGQSLARDLLAIAIECDHRPTLRRGSDAIAFALANFACRPAPKRLVLNNYYLKLGEFSNPRLVVRSGLGETTTRTPDDNEPKRGYASRWSSPTSGRSRMLSRADHLS